MLLPLLLLLLLLPLLLLLLQRNAADDAQHPPYPKVLVVVLCAIKRGMGGAVHLEVGGIALRMVGQALCAR